jgi:xylose isomerase
MEDIFFAHIAGMDTFARAFEITLDLLGNSPYKQMRADRYASFDSGEGAKFENGELSLEQLSDLALSLGEPRQISGKQELYEAIINQYIK